MSNYFRTPKTTTKKAVEATMATAAVTVVKSLGSRCRCIDTLNTSNIVTVLLLCFLDVPVSSTYILFQ
jgi:hypothetical protein